MAAAWVSRVPDASDEQFALESGLAVHAFAEVADLSAAVSADDARALVVAAYPDKSQLQIANTVGQVWAFRNLEIGDLIVLPRRSSTDLALGRVTGAYLYRPDGSHGTMHAVPVDWIRRNVPRDAIQADLVRKLNRPPTVFGFPDPADVRRLEALLETGTDPGSGSGALSAPNEFSDPPARSGRATAGAGSFPQDPSNTDYVELARVQQEIGDRGEQYVLELERRRLTDSGHADLAASVEHVAKTRGDGLGYDILSFDEAGNEMHIEVKATVGPSNRPFPISSAEVAFSVENPTSYWLYRVHDLDGSPRVYRLRGDITEHFELRATQYLAQR
jgi:predicted Mrr-cat superfamily restriction endonuclease